MNHSTPLMALVALFVTALSGSAQTAPETENKAPEFTINWELKLQKEARGITMREVQAPVFPKVEPTTVQPVEPNQTGFQPEDYANYHTVSVSATVYDGVATHLKVHTQQGGQHRVTEAWSNVDWVYLSGFASFEGRGRTFNFLMMAGTSSLEALEKAKERNPQVVVPEIPNNLPKLSSAGPRYTLTKTEGQDEIALEFLEAIHDLYAEKEAEIIADYNKREADRIARQEYLRLNPPKKKDVEVHFWNNDVNK